VIDDGSTDSSKQKVKEMGVELLENKKNLGRGHTRAKALERAKNDFVLCCDATNILENDFLAKVLPYFKDSAVASVSGRLRSTDTQSTTARWRSRHLFNEDVEPGPARPCKMLITYGTLMRRNPVMKVGNFDPTLTHTEDNELGLRLHAKGYKILGAPDAIIRSIAKPRLWKTLERYWRWNVGIDETLSIRNFAHNIKASIRPMAEKDLTKGDWLAAVISLICPYYCTWKTITRKLSGQKNRR
jgi:cellulose synthase/poly-beta-1,6-N-acetylglucosamine synthase-like glycosyltransferase